MLEDIHNNLFDSAEKRLKDNLVRSYSYDEMKNLINQGKFVAVPFAGTAKEEKQIKEETGATARCIPFDIKLNEYKECIITKRKTKHLVIFAKAY